MATSGETLGGSNSQNGDSLPLSGEESQQLGTLLKGLRFGNITITVQDGVIVQMDRTERHRLRQTNRAK